MNRWGWIYAAVSLTTTATLLLELALTRIFSVVLFYHFAFMAISVAMFGLGAGALFSYYWTGRRDREWQGLGWISGSNAAVIVATLIAILHQQVKVQVTAETASKLALIYFAAALPFFGAGFVLSTAVSKTMERVHRVYCSDLAGAAAGCILLVPLLNFLGGPNTVLSAAALYGLAGALWFRLAGRPRAAAGAVAVALLVAAGIACNRQRGWLDIRYAKGAKIERELFSAWNSFSRIGVKPDDGAGSPAIVIDGDAATSIPSFSPEQAGPELRAELLRSGPGLVYRLRPAARTLVIGPGGGYDVARALASGSTSVTGVEINPIIVNDVMRKRFAGRSRGLYLRPEVQIHVEDGRTFVRRPGPRYEVIQMTLVDTWASTASGAFALSENNLYTVEAFLDYFRRLEPEGMLSITRWEFEPPRESLRVVSLAAEALRRLGAHEPWRHFVIGREDPHQAAGYGAKDTVIVKKTPLTADELARARQAIEEARMHRVYLPGDPAANPFGAFLTAHDRGRFAKEYTFDISPVTDNRPFFFYTVRAGDLWGFVTRRSSEDVKINLGVIMLFAALGVSLVATALVLILPRWLLGERLPRDRSAWSHLLYFFAVGIGFIMAEIGFIQKFVLFLGSPTYSLTVVVFSLLIASGMGSYASTRLIGDDEGRLRLAVAGVTATIVSLALAVPPVVDAALTLPAAARCALTALLLFPAGFLMGMPFPCGLKRLERAHPAAVRWAWALNSASSVLGSVAAIFFAIHLGLLQTLMLGAAAYLLALGSLLITRVARARPAGL